MTIAYGSSGDIRSSLGNPNELEYSASSIALAQTRATNTIDAYVSLVYSDSIPFASLSAVPALLNSLATDLSIYYLKRDKHRGPNPMQAGVTAEYWDKPIEILSLISKGEMSIPELEAAAGSSVKATQSTYVPAFDEDVIENAVIDDDKIEDIQDAKDD